MKEYYLQAIELGDSNAMNNLGYYYKTIEKDYDKMKQYYLQAIELGYSDTMNNLGCHYETIEKDYDKMKQYYLKAIELGNSSAMNNLDYHYENNIELFIILDNIENKNEIITNKIFELRNETAVNNYLNKIKFSKENNIIKECTICLESKLNIIVD